MLYDEVMMRHLESMDDIYNMRQHSMPNAAATDMDVSLVGSERHALHIPDMSPMSSVPRSMNDLQRKGTQAQMPRKKLTHRKAGLFV